MKISVGETAPPFTLQDADGQAWALEDHRGKPVVLYFYPKDDTPGCTTQGCDIRDSWADFSDLGVEVVGVSPDDVASHARFASKYDLPHTLLADPERTTIDAYGVWGRKSMLGKSFEGVIRSSVVIDGEGKVTAVFEKIQPKQQSEKALQAVRELV